MSMTWQAVSGAALRLRTWGNEFIVYNGLSGDTHLLDAAAGQILQALCSAPLEFGKLAELLGEWWEVDADDEFCSQIERILDDLRALSLVEQR